MKSWCRENCRIQRNTTKTYIKIHIHFCFRDDPFIKDGDKVLKGNYATTEENIKFGCSAKYLKIRTKEEWILFQRKIPFFLIYIFSLAYLYPVVMRNVGFYLHHTMRDYVYTNGSLTQKSLYDLGHEVKTISTIFCQSLWNLVIMTSSWVGRIA